MIKWLGTQVIWFIDSYATYVCITLRVVHIYFLHPDFQTFRRPMMVRSKLETKAIYVVKKACGYDIWASVYLFEFATVQIPTLF